MDKIMKMKDRLVVVLTSVVTISVVVSQAGAEVVEAISGWDGQWVNLAAVVVAIVNIIRRVTPVAKEERGIL